MDILSLQLKFQLKFQKKSSISLSQDFHFCAIAKEILVLKSAFSIIDEMFKTEIENAEILRKRWLPSWICFCREKLTKPEHVNRFLSHLLFPFPKYTNEEIDKTNKIYSIHWKYNFPPVYKAYLLIITWINALLYYRSVCQADGYTAVIEANLGDTVSEIFLKSTFLVGSLCLPVRKEGPLLNPREAWK